MKDERLGKLKNRVAEWSDKTFGDGERKVAMANHLKKEVDELEEELIWLEVVSDSPEVSKKEKTESWEAAAMEVADCLLLILDLASHLNIAADELIDLGFKKQIINEGRIWGPPDENGVCEHLRDE